MSGHSTIFQKIAYSANFGHNGGKTTMSEKGRVSFSESHRLGLCGSEVKTCLHWSAYRTNWAPRVLRKRAYPIARLSNPDRNDKKCTGKLSPHLKLKWSFSRKSSPSITFETALKIKNYRKDRPACIYYRDIMHVYNK